MDKDIGAMIVENREAAFTLLYDTYWDVIFRQAYAKVGDEDIAADLSQETFTILWQKLEELPDIKSYKAFLLGILRNKTLQYFEKNKPNFKYIFEINRQNERVIASVHELLIEKETEDIIRRAIDDMPDQMRKIYLLKKEEEYSIQEISDQLALSPQTVKNQLHSAYTRLKKILHSRNNRFFTIFPFFL